MKYVLVTGGAGYIGSHACKALAQAGYVPIAYDNLVYGHRWAVKWGPFEHGDIHNIARLNEVIHKYQPLAVMHFAAYAYVGESVENPAKYYRNNVAGTLTLLEAMREHSIDKLIFSSTCATYGVPNMIPITENHPQQPINPYGASKLMIERMLQDFDMAHGLRSIVLRYFNAAGADPDGEIGEEHNPETHLIPLVLKTGAGFHPQVTVFGDDYDTPDGSCIRDYIHVSDLAQAHVLALQALENGAKSTAYNLGNGQGVSVWQIIERSQHITKHKVNVSVGSRRSGDPARLVGDATSIMSTLNWHPQYADLDMILETAWRWISKKTYG